MGVGDGGLGEVEPGLGDCSNHAGEFKMRAGRAGGEGTTGVKAGSGEGVVEHRISTRL